MIGYEEFAKKWNDMPVYPNGYYRLDVKHPLNFQVGYHLGLSKSFVVMDSGKFDAIPSSQAIKVYNRKTQDGIWIIEFQLFKEEFEDIFIKLCWDLVDASSTSNHPLDNLICRYMQWQKILQYLKPGIMSLQAQKGLLGELLFMKELINHIDIYGLNKEMILDSWVGPEGSDQDYIFKNSWSEIKAVTMSSEEVKISSLQQLDRKDKGTLDIYFLERTPSTSAFITLCSMIDDIRTELKDSDILTDRFNLKLAKYGFNDNDRDEYLKNKYRFVEHRVYEVTQNFPKLTRETVPAEVTECTYKLSIASLENYRRR